MADLVNILSHSYKVFTRPWGATSFPSLTKMVISWGAMEHCPNGRTRETATLSDVRYLMDHYPNLIPDLSITSITDRSKSDSFGKTVWVAQLYWFYMSCISRNLVEDLPLSLFEIITAAHTLYTIGSFIAWWYKPLNVVAPHINNNRRSSDI